MFKVGDRVKFTSFQGSGEGIGTISLVDYKSYYRAPTAIYDVRVKIEKSSKAYHKGEQWYFPFSHVTPEYTEVRYDPNQMVSEEDDL